MDTKDEEGKAIAVTLIPESVISLYLPQRRHHEP